MLICINFMIKKIFYDFELIYPENCFTNSYYKMVVLDNIKEHSKWMAKPKFTNVS